MAIIFISNTSSIPRAETIDIIESDVVPCKNDSMQAWINSGETKESWNRFTSLVYVTDKSLTEISYLLDPVLSDELDEDGNQIVIHNRKWYWSEPDPSNPFYQELFINGEVHITYNEMLPYLRERA